MTVPARSIPSRLAPLVEALELDQPRVVTRSLLGRVARDQGLDLDDDGAASELRRRGWLLPLRTRGAWEFAPGSRAGRFGAGDRHIELRAALALDSSFPGALAMESAAIALGFAGRIPDREVLSLPPGKRLPKALDDWRVVRLPIEARDLTLIGELPVWRVETLLVGMAKRPDEFKDWPNVEEWLGEAVGRAELDTIGRQLKGSPRSVWRRTGYLLAIGGRAEEGLALQLDEPVGHGPSYLGPRRRKGRYDKRFDIVDSVLAPIGTGGSR